MTTMQGLVNRYTPPKEREALETIVKTLETFDLRPTQTRVYLYLARNGPVKASSITDAIGCHRTETHKILRELERMSLISRIMTRPSKYMATPFPEAIKLLITAKRQELQSLENMRLETLSLWSQLPESENIEEKQAFIIRVTQNQIRVKLKLTINESACRLYYLHEDAHSRLYNIIPENEKVIIHNKPHSPSFIIMDKDLYIVHGKNENLRLIYFSSPEVVDAFTELYSYLEEKHGTG